MFTDQGYADQDTRVVAMTLTTPPVDTSVWYQSYPAEFFANLLWDASQNRYVATTRAIRVQLHIQ
jgi:hypothetical protein